MSATGPTGRQGGAGRRSAIMYEGDVPKDRNRRPSFVGFPPPQQRNRLDTPTSEDVSVPVEPTKNCPRVSLSRSSKISSNLDSDAEDNGALLASPVLSRSSEALIGPENHEGGILSDDDDDYDFGAEWTNAGTECEARLSVTAGFGRRSSVVALASTVSRKNEEPSLLNFLRSDWAQAVGTALIVSNAIFLGIETNFSAENPKEPVPLGYKIADVCFGVLYTLEILLKIIAEGIHDFFLGADCSWNFFDFVLASLQTFDLILSSFKGFVGKNSGFLRLMRIVRIARIVRLARIFRFIPELRTLVASIAGSMHSLVWTLAFIFVFVYCMAVYFTSIKSSKDYQHMAEKS